MEEMGDVESRERKIIGGVWEVIRGGDFGVIGFWGRLGDNKGESDR